jgi:hypothetical protein
VLRDWVQLDPASSAHEPPTPALRRLVSELLKADAPDDSLALQSERPRQLPSMPARPLARAVKPAASSALAH